jgi:DNA-binding transcriptional ArsR family regulator
MNGRDAVEIRIHFTPDDLARTRLVRTLSPVFETIYGACRLANDYRDPFFTAWVDPSRAALGPAAKPTVAVLTSPLAQESDLISGRSDGSLTAAVEDLRSIERRSLVAAVDDVRTRVAAAGRAAADPGQGVDTARVAMVLATAVQRFWEVTLSPHWPVLLQQAVLTHEQHVATVAERGMGALLSSLGPDVIWDYPVLRYPIFAPHNIRGEDVFLRGQGLILMPSVFLRRSAGLWLQHTNPDAQPVLSYPVGQDFRVVPWSRMSVETLPDQALTALIGPTRAAVLRELDQGSFTTSQLAQRLQISMASASEHASVLRDGGLTASHREGRRVYHALTSLGRALLAGRHGTNNSM